MSVKTTLRTSLLAALLGLPSASAQSQVALSPGAQTGSPGEIVEFAFGFEGDDSVVAGVGFTIVYGSNAPYIPVNTDGVVDCAIEPGANADAGLPFFDSKRNIFAVSFGDFSAPVSPIGKSGTIVRCRVKIKDDAALGTYPLTCVADSASASSAEGAALVATCTDGVLNIVPLPTPEPTDTPGPTPTPTLEPLSCVGDQDSNGSVGSAEAARAVLAFARRDLSHNPAADGDRNGSASSAEAARSTLNFIQRTCNP